MLDRALLLLKFLKNCDMFLLWVRLQGADDRQIKTNKFAVKFSRIFRWRRALSSKVFHWFNVAKCYSELKNEELSSKKLPPKLFGKSNFSGSLQILSPQIPVFSGQIKITSLFEIIHMCYVMNQLFLPIFCPLYILCLDLIWIIYFLSNSKDACISLHILAISLLKYQMHFWGKN